MCTYNGSAYLPEQLASIAGQTRLPEELVICDDGSMDCTPQIVADFAKSVSFPVRWIRNQVNLGSSKNFEKVIGLCTGDLIALSDQDDIWMPEKLARQSEMFERDAALSGVFSDAELVDNQSRPVGTRLWVGFRFTPHQRKKFRSGGEVAVLLKWNVVTGATLMIRADFRPVYSPIPSCWHHDGWIAWMAVLYSKLEFIEEPLIRYRVHANQQVGVPTLARSHRPPLRQRLERAKREEPARQLSLAREIEELAQRVAEKGDPGSQSALLGLRRKSQFIRVRATPSNSRIVRTIDILKNVRNFQRYEGGWKCMVGDIVMGLMPVPHELKEGT